MNVQYPSLLLSVKCHADCIACKVCGQKIVQCLTACSVSRNQKIKPQENIIYGYSARPIRSQLELTVCSTVKRIIQQLMSGFFDFFAFVSILTICFYYLRQCYTFALVVCLAVTGITK